MANADELWVAMRLAWSIRIGDFMNEQHKTGPSKSTGTDKIQGEGDYSADRRYRERTDRFLKSADVDDLAHKAAPRSKVEADEMAKAEQEGKAHAHLPERRKPVGNKRKER
jgi:hypothetical protein